MRVYAEWKNTDGSMEGHVFANWTAYNNWLPPIGISGVRVRELTEATPGEPCDIGYDDDEDEDEDGDDCI